MAPVVIVPFWNRLRDFTLYPFRGDAGVTLLGFSVALTLLGWVPYLPLLFWVGAYRYAFEILLATAHGRMAAPQVSIGVSGAVVWRYIALQILVLALPLLLAMVSPVLGFGLLVLMVLALPAAIMGLALTESLSSALNPSLWFAVMARVGWPYLALFGLLLVMQLSAVNAKALLAAVLPGILADGVAAAFTMWAMFATFHLMGYIVYQYHAAFGFEPSSLYQAAGLPYNRDRELVDAASVRVQDGDVQGAIELLRMELRSRAVSLEAHELYRRLLQQLKDRPALLDHGRSFLHLLMMEKQEKRALLLLRECFELDRDFALLEAEHAIVLAERARFGGQSEVAIRLLSGLLRQQPEHPSAAQWALHAVELLLRQSGREAEARGLLSEAKAACHDPDQRSRLDAQLAAIPG